MTGVVSKRWVLTGDVVAEPVRTHRLETTPVIGDAMTPTHRLSVNDLELRLRRDDLGNVNIKTRLVRCILTLGRDGIVLSESFLVEFGWSAR